MRAWGSAILAWVMICVMGVTAAGETAELPAAPEVMARAAVLMDAETGQVLYGKGERRRMQPASLTKIMTAMLALRYGNPDELVTMPPEGTDRMWESTTVGLGVGERMTLEDMVYAMLLPSANDAANAVAIHLAGDLDTFVGWMNGELRNLGLVDSHFQNAHGLPDAGHYTTAYDLAQITRAALEDPRFVQIAGSASHIIPATNQSGPRRLSHLSKMVVPGASSYYSGSIAAKTGWTTEAGNCLMTAAQRDGRTLIVIILKSDWAVADTAKLLDYGFGAFQRYSIRVPDMDYRTVTLTDPQGVSRRAVVPDSGRELSFLLPDGVGLDALRVRTPEPQALVQPGRLSLDLVAESGNTRWPYSLVSLELVLENPPLALYNAVAGKPSRGFGGGFPWARPGR